MTRAAIPLRVGISMCLLGEKVRFDAGHKKDRFITDVLGAYFEWVPVCPELDVGLGVPREPVRLVGSAESPRMIAIESGSDWTLRMQEYSQRKVRWLSKQNLSGFILKSASPSCGMERVKVYGTKGVPAKNGRGLFASSVMNSLTHLPVEEEGRLQDPGIRDNFIERVFAFHRLRHLQSFFSRKELVAFHTAHKFLLLSHSPSHYRQLGKLVAHSKIYSRSTLCENYAALFMETLRIRTTVKKHVNVLQHIFGFLKNSLSGKSKSDILAVIEDYRRGIIPLIVPVTLLDHHVRTNDIPYIKDQIYLHPHPRELMLRNHV